MKLKPMLFAAATALTALPALADEAEAGRQLVYTCTGCHGIPGYRNVYPHYHVPRIAGQSKEYLVIALKGYRNGDRSHPTMRAQGEALSDNDIDQIATYLSSLGEATR